MPNQEPANNQVEPQGSATAGAKPAGTEPQGNEPASGAGTGPEPKYTDADVDNMIQSRLARERAKLEREIREQVAKEADDAQTQAQKLENMTELQRAQYEARQLKAEKEALEAERDFSQQMGIARHELSEAGIAMPDELLSMFVSSEAEKTSAAIDKLKDLMPKYINEAVQRELKRIPPIDPGSGGSGGKSFGASFAENYSKQKNGGK